MKRNIYLTSILIILISIIGLKGISYSELVWYPQYYSKVPLNDICFANLNVGYAVGNSGTILKTFNGGREWNFLPNPGEWRNFLSCQFIGENLGWIGGDYILLKTIDGGNSWINQTPEGAGTISDIFFINKDIGWALCGNIVYKTIDGGASWEKHLTPATETLFSIYFVNSDVGWASGTNEIILKTIDGGINWVIQYRGTRYYISSIYFISESTGWAISSNGDILKTTDGGVNWNRYNLEPKGLGFGDIYFIDSLTGWIVGSGEGGIIKFTTDSGSTWTGQKIYTHPWWQSYQSISFIDINNIWVAGSPYILKYGTPPPPIISSVEPNSAPNTDLVSLNINGYNFFYGCTVRLQNSKYPDIILSGIVSDGEPEFPTKIVCTFDLKRVIPGTYDVLVTNPDGQEGLLKDGFIIISGDTTPPTITNFQPPDGSVVNIPNPTILAKVSDLESGINPATIELKLDGNIVSHTYNASTGLVSYTPTTPLSEGLHTVNLSVSDNAGNTATASWQFTVEIPEITEVHLYNATTPSAADIVIGEQYKVKAVATSGLTNLQGGIANADYIWQCEDRGCLIGDFFTLTEVSPNNYEYVGTLTTNIDQAGREASKIIAVVGLFDQGIFKIADEVLNITTKGITSVSFTNISRLGVNNIAIGEQYKIYAEGTGDKDVYCEVLNAERISAGDGAIVSGPHLMSKITSWEYIGVLSTDKDRDGYGTTRFIARVYFVDKKDEAIFSPTELILTCPPLAYTPYPMDKADLQHTGRTYVNGPDFPVYSWKKNNVDSFFITIGKDGMIYTTDGEASLTAFTPDGSIKWISNIPLLRGSTPSILADGNIVISGDRSIILLSSSTGERIWSFSSEFRSNFISPIVAKDGTIYTISTLEWKPEIYGIGCGGTLKIKKRLDSIYYSLSIGAEGTIYASSSTQLIAMTPECEIKFKVTLPLYFPAYTTSSPVILSIDGRDETIFICARSKSGDAELFAFSSSGRLKWTVPGIKEVSLGHNALIGIKDGYPAKVYAIDYNDGKILWEYTAGVFRFTSPPLIDGSGTIYVSLSETNRGELHAINQNGLSKWIYTFEHPVGHFAIDESRNIYVGGDRRYNSGKGNLYALKDSSPPPNLALTNTSWPKYRHDNENTGRSNYLGPIYPAIRWSVPINCGEDAVITTPDGKILAGAISISPDDGETQIWLEKKETSLSAGAIEGITAVSEIFPDGGKIYKGLVVSRTTEPAGGVLFFSPDGKLVWNNRIGTVSPACVDRNGIYVISSLKIFGLYTNGLLKWRYGVYYDGISRKYLAMDENGIVYGDFGAGLWAIEPDGRVKWRSGLTGLNPAVDTNNNIVYTTTTTIGGRGIISAFDRNTGEKKWDLFLGEAGLPISACAIGVEGEIYVSVGNTLYSIDSEGRIKWKYVTREEKNVANTSPVIGGDGTIYAGFRSRIIALTKEGKLKWTYNFKDIIKDVGSANIIVKSIIIGENETLYIAMGHSSHLSSLKLYSVRFGLENLSIDEIIKLQITSLEGVRSEINEFKEEFNKEFIKEADNILSDAIKLLKQSTIERNKTNLIEKAKEKLIEILNLLKEGKERKKIPEDISDSLTGWTNAIIANLDTLIEMLQKNMTVYKILRGQITELDNFKNEIRKEVRQRTGYSYLVDIAKTQVEFAVTCLENENYENAIIRLRAAEKSLTILIKILEKDKKVSEELKTRWINKAQEIINKLEEVISLIKPRVKENITINSKEVREMLEEEIEKIEDENAKKILKEYLKELDGESPAGENTVSDTLSLEKISVYPNPYCGTQTSRTPFSKLKYTSEGITFKYKAEGNVQKVTIEIYNIKGKLIDKFYDYTIDGEANYDFAEKLANGVYIYRITISDGKKNVSKRGKIVILR